MMSSSLGVETALAVSLSASVAQMPADDAGSSHSGGSDRVGDIDASPVDQKPTLWSLNNNQPLQPLINGDEQLNGVEMSSPSSGASGPLSDQTALVSSELTNGVNSIDAAATAADAEGVWSPDIEQAFQEALAIYPPCGRRKIILSEEGKMYGRNELIARYIKLRVGKTRTRKQVSSHIQVLARKKQREIHTKFKDHHGKDKALSSLSSMSSSQILSMGAMQKQLAAAGLGPGLYAPGSPFWQPGLSAPGGGPLHPLREMDFKDVKFNPYSRPSVSIGPSMPQVPSYPSLPLSIPVTSPPANQQPSLENRSIMTPRIRLCELLAYVEPLPESKLRHEMVRIEDNAAFREPLENIDMNLFVEKFPQGKDGIKDLYEKGPANAFFLVKFWADISFSIPDDQNAFYAVDSRYETSESMTIMVSNRVCSFGKQVVEKVETEYPMFDASLGRFVYRIARSPMCEYMIKFIHQLKKLNDPFLMNSVLENFTVLQVVTNKDTREILLVTSFVFAVGEEDGPSQCRIFRLTRSPTSAKAVTNA